MGIFKAPQRSGQRHEQEPQPQTSLANLALCAGRTRTAALTTLWLRPASPQGASGAPAPEGNPRHGGPDPHAHPCTAQGKRLQVLDPPALPQGRPVLSLSHPMAEEHPQARMRWEKMLSGARCGEGVWKEFGCLEAQDEFFAKISEKKSKNHCQPFPRKERRGDGRWYR